MKDTGVKNPKYNKYIGVSREELIDSLGVPDQVGGVSRKYKTPQIYSYDGIEYHFNPWKNGSCWMVFDNKEHKILASVKLMMEIKNDK